MAADDLPQTSWTLLADVCAGGERSAAMAEFARRYYGPVLAYLTALAGGAEEGRDLTQAFFTSRVLTGRLLAGVDRTKGSFRPYLKRAAKNFFLDTLRRQARAKRGGTERALALEQAGGLDLADSSGQGEPEAAFHQAWVRSLLEEALATVSRMCEARQQKDHFELFRARYLHAGVTGPSWSELGARFNLGEKAARARAETVARHFRLVLREMLRIELGSRRAVDEELATLRALL